MTDVPFLSVLIAAMYFAVRSLRYGQHKDFWWTVGLGFVATFLRQYGVVFLGLFLITNMIGRLKERNHIALCSGLLLVAGASLLAFRSFLVNIGLPGCYTVWGVYIKQALAAGFGTLCGTMLFNYLTEVIYLGLFIIPFAVACIPLVFAELVKKERIFGFVCAAELIVCLLIGLAVKGVLMPMTTNVLHVGGVGPVLLADFGGIRTESLGFVFWLLISVLACKGVGITFALIVTRLLSLKRLNLLDKWRDDLSAFREVKIAFLFASFIVVYLTILAFTGLIDRYTLPALPALFVLLGLLSDKEKLNQQVWAPAVLTSGSVLLLLFLTSFSVAATHDYFALSRARWDALNSAIRDLKVDPKSIEGGWEFNGWAVYAASDEAPKDLSMKNGDDYAVSSEIPAKYSIVRSWNVDRWLPSTLKSIYLLRKDHW